MIIKTTSINLCGRKLVLTIPETALCNRQHFCICLAQDIPTGITSDTTVKIAIDGAECYQTIGCMANEIYADQLRNHRTYGFSFATDTKHFIYRCGTPLCPTKHIFNCVPFPARKTVSNVKVSAVKVAKTPTSTVKKTTTIKKAVDK